MSRKGLSWHGGGYPIHGGRSARRGRRSALRLRLAGGYCRRVLSLRAGRIDSGGCRSVLLRLPEHVLARQRRMDLNVAHERVVLGAEGAAVVDGEVGEDLHEKRGGAVEFVCLLALLDGAYGGVSARDFLLAAVVLRVERFFDFEVVVVASGAQKLLSAPLRIDLWREDRICADPLKDLDAGLLLQLGVLHL